MPKKQPLRRIDSKPTGAKRVSGLATGGGGSAGDTGLTIHDLNGPYHSGTLADAQAPQFLKTDGSRALTGNLVVSTGVLIDGVDIDVHAADSDAHHAAFIGLKVGSTNIDPDATDRVLFSEGTMIDLSPGGGSLTIAVDTSASPTWTGTHTFNNSIIFPDNKGIYNDSGGSNVYKIILDDRSAPASWTGNGARELAIWSDNIISFVESDNGVDVGYMSLNSYKFVWKGKIEIRNPDGGSIPITLNNDDNASAIADIQFNKNGVIGASTSLHFITDTNADGAGHFYFYTNGAGTATATLIGRIEDDGDIFFREAQFSGNLYVGGTGLANTVFNVDVATGNVGINRQADPQFDLDVNGPIRGTYLIGKHAIQLEDAEHIWHFDGPEDGSSDGTIMSHAGLTPNDSLTSGYTFSRGKFGKALTTSAPVVNLATNPSVETDANGWSWWVNTGSGSGGRVSGTPSLPASRGDYYYRHTCTSGAGNVGFYTCAVNVSPNTTYTLSIDVRIMELTSNFSPYVREFYSGGNRSIGTIKTFTAADADGEWQRISLTVTTSADATSLRISGYLYSLGEVHYDAFQVTQTDHEVPYTDGSLGPGYSWSGTAHASTSSCVRTYARYDVTAKPVMTLMLWKRYYSLKNGDRHWNIRWYNSALSNRQLLLGYANTGENLIRFYASVDNGYGSSYHVYYRELSDPENTIGTEWRHYAVVINLPEQYIQYYLDGKPVNSTPLTPAVTSFGDYPWNVLEFGDATGGGDAESVDIDDVVYVSRALDDDEIRAIYESNAPVFAESSVSSFRSPTRSPIWVDQDGLFARGPSGKDIFAIYANTGSAFSWGNLTLSEGDIVMGNNTDGYVWFDVDYGSATKLRIKAEVNISGTSTLDGTLDVSSGGGIYVGSGSFATPSYGVKLWDPDGYGGLSMFNSGVEEFRIDGEGISLYAPTNVSPTVPSIISWYTNVSTKQYQMGYLLGWYDSTNLQHRMDVYAYASRSGFEANLKLVADSASYRKAHIQVVSDSSGSYGISGGSGYIELYANKIALGDGGYGSHASADWGIYYRNTAEGYTSMHYIQEGWGNTNVMAWGATYHRVDSSHDPMYNTYWKNDFPAGSYSFGPGAMVYTANGGYWSIFISGVSAGTGTNPTWDRKMQIRRDDMHAIYGLLHVLPNGDGSADSTTPGVVIGGSRSSTSLPNMVDVGHGLTREANAGKIAVNAFVSNSLNIVGFGTASNNRRVDTWNEGGFYMRGELVIQDYNGKAGDLTVYGMSVLNDGFITYGSGTINGNLTVTGTLTVGSFSPGTETGGYVTSGVMEYPHVSASATVKKRGGVVTIQGSVTKDGGADWAANKKVMQINSGYRPIQYQGYIYLESVGSGKQWKLEIDPNGYIWVRDTPPSEYLTASVSFQFTFVAA